MKTLLLFTFVFSVSFIYGQQNVVSSGARVMSSSGSVNFSVGLIHYEEATGSGGTSSPGIQNISEVLNTLSVSLEDLEKIRVYPNPTIDFVNVDAPNGETLAYRLVSILGKTLLTGEVKGSNDPIDVSRLRTASYFLILYQKNQKIRTFQIIRQ
jgi:hypothetical protein